MTTEWATTAETLARLRIGRSSLLGMRSRGELVAGVHYYQPSCNRLRWNPDAILATLIALTPGRPIPSPVKGVRKVETYDMAGIEE